ncbi:sporozoite surface protein 2-like [Macrobrachium nipponense]|uniref:sporozoite surface protein 2-like n=1 Tax=Macrobrachium nipponense TaxID=159736 RepID=UPI0030C7D36B
MDVNEKILQSLKLSENEPLNLASESAVNQESTNKNAVDVALSLSSAFEPEPEDVDLDDLVRDPSPEKTSEEVRSLSPVKQPSPVKEPSPMKEPVVVKEPTPDKQLTSVKEPTPVKEVNPVKQPSNPEAPTNDKKPVRPKQLSIEKQSVPQNDPSSVQPVTSVPKSNQNEMPKDKNQTSFNFGLPKTSTSNIPMNFGVPKPDGGFQANSIIANALKDVDLGNHSKEEKVPEGPTIDLDAPVASTKPVLLVDKTEAEDLEDWLDSVLDD